ncbi:hypothetical protein GOP47_0027203 [Adiantum capillus-veneris]|nr:hypothetical protein GOP47_0027203 [Adiantum capillus-veneris]
MCAKHLFRAPCCLPEGGAREDSSLMHHKHSTRSHNVLRLQQGLERLCPAPGCAIATLWDCCAYNKHLLIAIILLLYPGVRPSRVFERGKLSKVLDNRTTVCTQSLVSVFNETSWIFFKGLGRDL